MKNILIIGVGRAGKTTLSQMIKNKYNSYNLIHSDSLKWSIIKIQNKEDFYRNHFDKQKEFEYSENFQRILLELYNSLIKKDKNKYGYILESGQLEPRIVKEMVDTNNTIILCLGLGNLSLEEMVEQCIKYDTNDSWTYGLSKECLLEYANDWYNRNEMFKKECVKYEIKYIDTSNNRIEILNNILEEI